MFARNLLILTICLTIPSSIFSQNGSDLMSPDFIKKYLPQEYQAMALSQVDSLKAALGQQSTSTSTTTTTLPAAAPVLPTIPALPTLPTGHSQVAHNHSHAAPTLPTVPTLPVAPVATPAFNPYMPSPAAQNNMHTHYAPAAPAPVAAPVHSNAHSAPVANTGGPVNPFISGGTQIQAPVQTELYLEADLNATPVFHPPADNVVPQYPPVEGQHWYQYRIAGY